MNEHLCVVMNSMLAHKLAVIYNLISGSLLKDTPEIGDTPYVILPLTPH